MSASFGSLRREDQRCDTREFVAIAQLVGEKDGNVEDPGRGRNVLTGQRCCNLIVDVQDGEDFGSRDSVQSQQEDDGETDIEPDSRLLACLNP